MNDYVNYVLRATSYRLIYTFSFDFAASIPTHDIYLVTLQISIKQAQSCSYPLIHEKKSIKWAEVLQRCGRDERFNDTRSY